MLLRSSSAPILGSLLHTTTTPFSDSSTTHHHHPFSCHFSDSSTTHHHHPFSCHFSDSTDHPPPSSVRRSRSDGNLHALLSDHPNDTHHHHHHHPPPHSSSRLPALILETIPSFSVYHTTDLKEEVEEDMNDMDEVATTMERGFSFEKQNVRMATSPLFLARGLGIDRIGSGLMNAGGGGDGGGGGGCYGGGGQSDIEAYYKRMIDENPSNAVFLRNYAQFLYQKRGDIQRAEEYYSRAILLDPGDGEIMSHYAKLVWELHGDEERASSYFERAVQAAPQDSHVLAAYARFLWEVEDEDCGGELGDGKLQNYVGSFQHGILASAT